MKSAAKSNQGGYETEQCYPLWKRINRHLDRFDQLYISFIKLVETCRSESTSSWLTRLDSSGWYLNARQAMHISSCIADEIHNKNACVIVHGSDGLDNTLLITSLVKLMLNDEYRTMNGIQMLIEGEWLSAGHPFAKRCAKSAFAQPTGSASGSVGPTFVLFLDCVRLLLDQFCVSFEFNQEFLVFLFDNVYASQYGTFLANCARERNDLFVKERTVSLWSFVNLEENLKVFLNPIYEKNTGNWILFCFIIICFQQ
jgi:myotubularin-related protein 9